MEAKASKNRAKRQRKKEGQKAKRQKKNSNKIPGLSSGSSEEEVEVPNEENKEIETTTTCHEESDRTLSQECEEITVNNTKIRCETKEYN